MITTIFILVSFFGLAIILRTTKFYAFKKEEYLILKDHEKEKLWSDNSNSYANFGLLFIAVGVLVINLCYNKNSSENNQIANESIEYDLQNGYRAFVKDTMQNKDSLAKAQIIYIIENYGINSLKKLDNNILVWLKKNKIDLDSIEKAKKEHEELLKNYESNHSSSTYQSADINPCIISKDFIERNLRYPSSADFSMFDCSNEQNSDGSYTVLRKVGAKNAFGVESKFIFKVKFGFKGGNENDINDWELINIQSEEVR